MREIKSRLSALILFASFVIGGTANAASMSWFMDQSNALPDGVNYLTVTIDDEGAAGDINFTVEVNVAAFTPDDNFGMQSFFFNFDNSLSVTTSSIVDVDPTTWAITEDRNAGGGFGKFEFQLAGTGATRTETLTFSITGVAGDTIESYAMAAGFLNNGSDQYFAAHVAGFVQTEGVTSAKFAGMTLVPVPAAAWLMFSALGVLALRRRRR